MRSLALLCLLLPSTLHLPAQSGFYDPFTVREIRINFDQPGWRGTLDSLMKSGDDSTRITATILIDGKSYPRSGVRFKGFSSWNEGEAKNPFNIELDYSISNRNHKGYKKLKLSNVIHDPSFLREVLAYSVARQYMPASEAAFALLHVNDSLIGLYTSVESVDDVFMEKHFGNSDAILIKGSPQKLVFPFGQNANLQFISSSDSLTYYPYYQLDSDYGWQALMHFIDLLNNQPESLSLVLDVDRALWMHAFNYTLLNLDSYIGYAQNYYLAMDVWGRFNTIPWDLNMSFGSFRNSDGSSHFNGLSIAQIKTLDPLQHLSFSISPRPLLTRLLSDSTHRRMYLAHIRTIMQEQIESGQCFSYAQQLHSFIEPYVLADTNKFYSDSAFTLNLTSTVGGSGGMLAYVGLKELMDDRLAFLQTYPGYGGAPQFMAHDALPLSVLQGDSLWITTRIQGAKEVFLWYRQGRAATFSPAEMYDDGLHADQAAGDGIFGSGLQVNSNPIDYYFFAQNDSAGTFLPARASNVYFTYYPVPEAGVLVINEIYRDDPGAGGKSDMPEGSWIELFNNSPWPCSLKGLQLVSAGTAQHSLLPDSVIPGHGYMLLLDGVSTEFAGLALGLEGEDELRLEHVDGLLIDRIAWTGLSAPLSRGRYPNGYGVFTGMQPSFSMRNNLPYTHEPELKVIPNPAREQLIFNCHCNATELIYSLLDASGRSCREGKVEISGEEAEVFRIVPLAGLAAGIYTLQTNCSGQVVSQKVIVYE